jgi:nitronate monooxygenase
MAMGTRFIPTQECPVHPSVKERFLQASEETAEVTPLITGTRCRGLRSKMVELLEERGEKAFEVPQTPVEHSAWGAERMRVAFHEGDLEMGFLPCGQVVGRIDDIPTCKELIERIMKEAEQVLAGLDARFAGQ